MFPTKCPRRRDKNWNAYERRGTSNIQIGSCFSVVKIFSSYAGFSQEGHAGTRGCRRYNSGDFREQHLDKAFFPLPFELLWRDRALISLTRSDAHVLLHKSTNLRRIELLQRAVGSLACARGSAARKTCQPREQHRGFFAIGEQQLPRRVVGASPALASCNQRQSIT